MLVEAGGFNDPLDMPTALTSRANSSLMLSVANAGSRLVAVGEFGRIIVSNDKGLTWQQVTSPVSADLVSIFFSSSTTGWATGHGGVVLNTIDGGLTWKKVIDGRDVETLTRDYYQQRLKAGDTSAERFLRDMALNFANGPELPFLDVWFSGDGEGFVVGAYGMILSTNDGGSTWTPWMDRVENPDMLHLNAVSRVGDEIYIVGERGMVWRLNSKAQQFTAYPTGYNGSLFGVSGDAVHVIAFGLRGNAYRSSDRGVQWERLKLPTQASINDGILLPDGRLALVTQAGQVITGALDKSEFEALRVKHHALLASLTLADPQTLVVAGISGVHRQPLAPTSSPAQ